MLLLSLADPFLHIVFFSLQHTTVCLYCIEAFCVFSFHTVRKACIGLARIQDEWLSLWNMIVGTNCFHLIGCFQGRNWHSPQKLLNKQFYHTLKNATLKQ